MARFKILDKYSLKDLGTSIFNLGADYHNYVRLNTDDEGVDENVIEVAKNALVNEQKKIEGMFDFPLDDESIDSKPDVKFHYDGQQRDHEKYVLHIIVPDMKGKRVDPDRLQKSGLDPQLDITDFATESLGHIVIMGCGR